MLPLTSIETGSKRKPSFSTRMLYLPEGRGMAIWN